MIEGICKEEVMEDKVKEREEESTEPEDEKMEN
jgi:hypothetical protein